MSTRQLVSVVRAALKDASSGLESNMRTIASQEALDLVRFDLDFPKWIKANTMTPGSGFTSSVTIVPMRTQDETIAVKAQPVQRDGLSTLRITYEHYGTDPAKMEDNILVAYAACNQVLDSLREFSDLHGGTVAYVQDPVSYEFGAFDDNGTQGGFICTVTIIERGNE